MSLVQTLKSLETDKAALAAENAGLKTEIAAVRASVEKAGVAAEQAAAAAKTELEALRADLTARITAAEQSLAAKTVEAAELVTKLEAAQTRADSAERKLRDPAFEHASAPGQRPLPEQPGEAVSDAEFLKAYEAENSPTKRAQMWRDRFEATNLRN